MVLLISIYHLNELSHVNGIRHVNYSCDRATWISHVDELCEWGMSHIRVDESCEWVMWICHDKHVYLSIYCLFICQHWCIYCLIIQKDMRSWWAMWIILFTWMNHITRSSEWVMWMNNLNESWDTYEWIRNYSNNWVMSHVRTDEYCKWTIWMRHDTHMGWLRIVGSMKLYVSFAEWCLFYRALLSCL